MQTGFMQRASPDHVGPSMLHISPGLSMNEPGWKGVLYQHCVEAFYIIDMQFDCLPLINNWAIENCSTALWRLWRRRPRWFVQIELQIVYCFPGFPKDSRIARPPCCVIFQLLTESISRVNLGGGRWADPDVRCSASVELLLQISAQSPHRKTLCSKRLLEGFYP